MTTEKLLPTALTQIQMEMGRISETKDECKQMLLQAM